MIETIYSEIIRYFIFFAPSLKQENTDRDLDEVICEFFDITKNDLLSHKRNAKIINARRLYIYILRSELNWGATKVGKYIGFNHSGVIYHCRKCKDLISTEKNYKSIAQNILRGIKDNSIKKPVL